MSEHLTDAEGMLKACADWHARTGGTLGVKLTCFEATAVTVELARLRAEVAKLTASFTPNGMLASENKQLRTTVEGSKNRIEQLEHERTSLAMTEEKLRKEIEWLQLNNDMLTDDPEAHKRALAERQAIVDERDHLRGEVASLRRAYVRPVDIRVQLVNAQIDLTSERARHDRLRKAVLNVLCDPEGKACFSGSPGDRAVIDVAMQEGQR